MTTELIRPSAERVSAIVKTGHRPVPRQILEIFPNQIAEMRGWLSDIDFPDHDTMPELWVFKYIEAHYDGGIPEFLLNVPRD